MLVVSVEYTVIGRHVEVDINTVFWLSVLCFNAIFILGSKIILKYKTVAIL